MSLRARFERMDMGDEQLRSDGHGGGGCERLSVRALVEVGDERSGSNGHCSGRRRAVAFE